MEGPRLGAAMSRLKSKSAVWFASASLVAIAGLLGLEKAQSIQAPDLCGGVTPCPPPCLGPPEVADDPQEFIELAKYQLGRPRPEARYWGGPRRPGFPHH